MKSSILALATTAAGTAYAAEAAGAYSQCGGMNWNGPTECASGYTCQSQNPYYYQCTYGVATATEVSNANSASASVPASAATSAPTTLATQASSSAVASTSIAAVASSSAASKAPTTLATRASTSTKASTSKTVIKSTSAVVSSHVSTSQVQSSTVASSSVVASSVVASSSAVAASRVVATAADTASGPAATDICDATGYMILSGTPWIVDNMFYDSAGSVGTQCTNYQSQTTDAAGNPAVVWSSVTDIEYVESTNNVPKGYSFIGLTSNLETQISGIEAIPASYEWTRTNSTAFKGNVCFDFMTSDTKGDSTSTSAQELMLWLQYEGGQLPIGWASGSVATIDNLYGTSWNLYEGKNTDTGITVHSMLPTTQFDGSFTGDIKDWLEALVTHGTFTDSTYVNVGNAGTEYFYGSSTLNATLGLQINLS